MKLELSAVEELSPDESSTAAAKKLTEPANWPVLGQQENINTIWGECQGSGKKPYYTVANIVDHSYKCTCPSRKLPCKHTLSLMMQCAIDADKFAKIEPPQWVNEWLERTEKSKALKETKAKNAAKVLTPEEQLKKDLAARKRAETARKKTVAGVTLAMQDLQKWVDNQLDSGLTYFIDNTEDECEKIAARMVDAKAASIATRIKDIPEKVHSVPESNKIKIVFQELAKVSLLAKYWLMDPDDVDLFQSVVTTQKKDTFIDSDESEEITGQWLKVAQRVDTKIKGLTSNESWYMRVDQAEPVFAMTLDYYRKKDLNQDEWHRIGDVVNGTFQYYPSRHPMRAVLKEHTKVDEFETDAIQHQIMKVTSENIWQKYAQTLRVIPWQDEIISIIENGYITIAPQNIFWWVSCDEQTKIKLTNNDLSLFYRGCTWQRAVIITNGSTGELCSVYSDTWGFYDV